MQPVSYARHQFPAAIIRHAVWLYLRFTLSYRDIEELLAERGIEISYETVRRWVLKFGPLFARNLRRLRPRPTGTWHLDEMVILSANSAGCSGGGGDRGAERNDPVADRPHTALRRRFCPGPKPTQPGPANSPTVSNGGHSPGPAHVSVASRRQRGRG